MNRTRVVKCRTVFRAAICSLVATAAALSAKPNIILVMADDQGWGDTGYNGHPFVKTPALDEMAAEAFVFDRFYAGAPGERL